MTYTDDALAALSGPRWNIADAPAHVPDKPGLYTIFGDDKARTQLGLERRPDDLLYVGKAEDSLVSRELRGGTLPSTWHAVRRLAAAPSADPSLRSFMTHSACWVSRATPSGPVTSPTTD